MKIDLGEPMGGGLSAPTMPEMPEKYYPSITIRSKESRDLPDEGTACIHFKKKSEEIRKDEEGNTTYTCTLELRLLDKIEGESNDVPKNRGKDTEDALDALVSAHKKSKGSY